MRLSLIGSQGIGGFGFDFLKPALIRTSQQPVNETGIGSGFLPMEKIFSGFQPLNGEALPRQNPILLPDVCRQDKLPLAGNCGSHA